MSVKIKSGDIVYYCGKSKKYLGVSGVVKSIFGLDSYSQLHIFGPTGYRIALTPTTKVWSTTPPKDESSVLAPTEVKVGQVWNGHVSENDKVVVALHEGSVVFSSLVTGTAGSMILSDFIMRHNFISEPDPVKEKFIIVSTAKHRGQGTVFDSYEAAAEHAKKIHHSVLICQVVAESKTEMVLEKI